MEIVSAFNDIMLPLLQRACNDPRLQTVLGPALYRKQAQGQSRLVKQQIAMEAKIDRLLAQNEGLLGIVRKLAEGQDIEADSILTLPEMELLADKFGGAETNNREDLLRFLSLKAEEYDALKSEVDNIEDGLKRLSNLKAAAQDAIARVDLDEVEELLSRVQEVELEEAAKTAELRAQNALLRGNTDQAYRLLSAAADSFAAVSQAERIDRRLYKYPGMLRGHALRYGGEGFIYCLKMVAPFEDELDPQEEAKHVWSLKVWQGNALQDRGTRTEGAKGAGLLADAVTAYRAALEVRTRAEHPVGWAMTQNNLGNALQNQGIRTGGAKGAFLLADAVNAYPAALEVYTRAEHPVDWAGTQNNLGNALADQGTRTDGAQGADLLADAVTAYRAALEIRTRADHPVHWAGTQNNLGTALSDQGIRSKGAVGADLLDSAITAYRAALAVYTRADHPVDWAMTQNNLGAALKNQGTRTEGAKGADLLADAITAYRAALEVRARADHPVQWGMAQGNIASAELARADHDTCADPGPHLRAALQAVEGALEVFDPDHMSYDHGVATRLRDKIQARLAALAGEA